MGERFAGRYELVDHLGEGGGSSCGKAATLLHAAHPGLAELLQVYGLGRTAQAREHYARVTGS